MRINHNLASLNTYRQLSTNTASTSKSLEKLSSGLRINRAGDDAAGLAISEKMRGQIRGLDQATRNAQDGISMIQTAEGSLNETQSILQRMKELATQAANSTNVEQDRTEIQKEINQLTSEINRIGNTTEFNTQKLLNGGSGVTSQIRYSILHSAVSATGTVVGELENITPVRGSVAQSSTTVAATTSTASRKGEAIVVGEFAQPVEVTASVKGGTGAIYGFNVDEKSTKAGGAIGTPTFDVVNTSVAAGEGTVSATNTLVAGASAAVTVTAAAGGADPAAGSTTVQIDFANLITGDTITIDGKVFTAGATTNATTFELDTDTATTLTNLHASLTAQAGADAVWGARWNFTDDSTDTLTVTATTGGVGSEPTITKNLATPAGAVIAAGVAGDAGTAATGSIQITSNFAANQTITIAGQTFTAVDKNADITLRQFNIGAGGTNAANIATTVTNLKNAINASAANAYSANSAADTITLTDKTPSTALTAIGGVTAGAGTTAVYAFDVETNFSVGDKIQIGGQTLTAVDSTGANGPNTFKVDADRDATAANIRTALGLNAAITANYSISNIDPTWIPTGPNPHLVVFTSKAAGVDANAGTMTATVTSTPPTQGQYRFEIKDNLVDGQKIEIGGKTFTAKTTVADATKEFAIGATTVGTANNLKNLLADAANGLGSNYTVANGTGIYSDTVILTEITASGKDLKTPTVSTVAAQAGKYSFDLTRNFSVGDKIEINGVTLKAVTSGAVAGDGTFDIGTGATDALALAATAASLKTAIEGDNTLKDQYTVAAPSAGVAGAGTKLTITEKVTSGTDLDATDIKVVKTPATQGAYDLQIKTNITAGEKVTIAGREFTAVASNATSVADNQFKIDTTAALTAASLVTQLNKDTTLKGVYSSITSTTDTIHLVEKAGSEQAAIPTATIDKAVDVTGKYNIKFANGIAVNDKITIAGTEFTAGAGAGATDFAVAANTKGTIDNLIAKINAPGSPLKASYLAALNINNANPLAPVYSIDLTELAASGDDTKVTGATATKVIQATGTLGQDTFEVKTNLAAGDKLNVGDISLLAGTDFAIGADTTETATNIAAVISAKATATSGYTANSAGNKILITEVKASGSNLNSSNTKVTANAEAGKFEFAMNALNAGSKIKIDSTELTSTKGGSEIATAAELKDLIDNNTTLSAKYSVTVTGANVTLTQKAGQESTTNPTMSFSTTAGSGFVSNMQIGANSGQSMSVEIKDMRSLALNVSSATATTGQTVEVEGKQYTVAWTAATTVTNGSDSIATEFALDVSRHDNATAAIKVLDTAINSVSSERSRLGAYQNRMEHTINNLGTSSENMTAAESRIRDVDMAKEMMEFTKNNILTQAAQAMLAQANQQPQGVLQLLR